MGRLVDSLGHCTRYDSYVGGYVSWPRMLHSTYIVHALPSRDLDDPSLALLETAPCHDQYSISTHGHGHGKGRVGACRRCEAGIRNRGFTGCTGLGRVFTAVDVALALYHILRPRLARANLVGQKTWRLLSRWLCFAS